MVRRSLLCWFCRGATVAATFVAAKKRNGAGCLLLLPVLYSTVVVVLTVVQTINYNYSTIVG